MVAVNVTDFKNNAGDVNCIVEIGEHPMIRKRSVVRYCDAVCVTTEKLELAEQECLLVRRAAASADLIARMRAGALTSDDMAPRYANIIRSN